MRYILFICVLSILIYGCQQSQEEREEAIAKKTCSTCHKFPDPSLLDKKTWANGVLPEMSYRLGIGNRFELLTKIPDEQYQSAMALDIYPETPQITQEEWNMILAYYQKNAPEKPIPQAKKSPISTDTLHFTKSTFISPADALGGVTSIRIHPKKAEVWVGMRTKMTYVLDAQLKKKQTLLSQSPNVNTQFIGDKTFVLGIGKMYPNDQKLGNLYTLNSKGQLSSLVDSLKRPVDLQVADFNTDGVLDYVICEYGFEAGQLIWVDGKSWQRHPLKLQAGARNVIIKDYTGDGIPDVLVLMAQANEGVSLFVNKGMGIFVEKPLLKFDPVFGSSYMEVADMNRDGYDDIIISNGDNADYSHSKKAYHGVHIFMNDRKNNFKEAYFYPAFGASKTVAKDFDQDGDLDLAMIAFFAENDHGKNESFLYFQNQGGLTFHVSNLNLPDSGHYIAMDAGDVDKDGDIDILLGNYLFGSVKPGDKITPGLQLRYIKNLIR